LQCDKVYRFLKSRCEPTCNNKLFRDVVNLYDPNLPDQNATYTLASHGAARP